MSSISAADRSRKTDELRTQREEFENREAETAKKHKRTQRKMAEHHEKEIEDIKKTYEERIEKLKQRTNTQLTTKDQENTAKIEKLRGLYTESLKRKQEENQMHSNAYKEASEARLNKQKDINEQQRNILKREFSDALQEKDRNFNTMANHAREEMQETISENRERMNKKHNSDIKSITADRDERISHNNRVLNETKSVLNNQIKDQARQHKQTLDNRERSWMNTYTENEYKTNELLTGRNVELKHERDRMQNKYNTALSKKEQQMDEVREELKEDVANRIDRDLKSAESENRRLKNQHLVEMSKTKRLEDLKSENLIAAYEDRMAKLATSKDGLIEVAREVNRERMIDNTRKNEMILQETNRRHKTDQLITTERQKENLDRLNVEHNSQMQHLRTRTDDRVDKLMKITSQNQKNQLKMHAENIGTLKDSYQEELSHQRQAQMEQLKDTYLRMDSRVKSSQDKLTKKLEETVDNYEAKIAQMKDQHRKELQKQAETYEQRMKQQKSQASLEQQSQDMKFDTKVDQLQQQHDKEIDRLHKRHQEELASLAQKLNYYRKNS